MKNKRNYWTQQPYIDFVYEKGFTNSKEYIHVCEKLQRDHDRLQIVYKNVEQLKLRAKRIYPPRTNKNLFLKVPFVPPLIYGRQNF